VSRRAALSSQVKGSTIFTMSAKSKSLQASQQPLLSSSSSTPFIVRHYDDKTLADPMAEGFLLELPKLTTEVVEVGDD
jgi:hypothetical protein